MFHQGEQGDRSYVIEDGEADVIGEGDLIRMGRGDGSGEIALLDDTVRTTTVPARVRDPRLPVERTRGGRPTRHVHAGRRSDRMTPAAPVYARRLDGQLQQGGKSVRTKLRILAAAGIASLALLPAAGSGVARAADDLTVGALLDLKGGWTSLGGASRVTLR